MAISATRSCPVEMPPSTPPALLLAKPVGVSSSPCSLPRWLTAPKPAPDLHALDRVDAHQRVGDVGVELVEERSPRPTGTPVASTRMRAPTESPDLRSASM